MWKEQKRRVDDLSLLANARSAEAFFLRARMRAWKQEFVAGADLLAWAFATGAWWAAARHSRTTGLAAFASMLLTTSKAVRLIWKLIDRTCTTSHYGQEKRSSKPFSNTVSAGP